MPPTPDDARRAHYSAFFGLSALPSHFGLVVGNCQAESLRIVIDSDERTTVRVPPVHEMDAAEAARLHELTESATFVVTQPIRDGYRGLPLGTAQLRASMASGAPLVTVTPVRFEGLYPFQAALRVPGFDHDPPIVAYHDVRTLAMAAGLATAETLGVGSIRRIGHDSLDELRRRERETSVAVADLFDDMSTDLMRTVNHPGNALWLPLGARLIEALGLPGEPTDPGRPLLAAVRAPLEAAVLEAWGLPDEPRAHWLVDGRPVDVDEIRKAHLEWYSRNPEFVRAAVGRTAKLLEHWRAA